MKNGVEGSPVHRSGDSKSRRSHVENDERCSYTVIRAVFAFGINWILMAWAISLGRVLESRSGAWDGLSVRLPHSYYATRPFEKGGRVYDYFGVRWYQRLLRRVLWSVNPTVLRSRRGTRQAIIRATQDPEAGHLVIFIVIGGITLWALVSGWWDTAAWLLLFNVLHNGYPVLSVRQLRARLQRRTEPA
jgi:hypothetical protein